MAKSKAPIGRSELEVLQFIVDRHPIKVSEVAQNFADSHGLARTTVLTMVERLRAKGYLAREKREGAWQYSPKVSKGTLLRDLIGTFVNETLGGSLAPFVTYLGTKSDTLSDEEVARLEQLVKELKVERRRAK